MPDLRAQLLAAATAGPDPDGAPTRIARFCDAAGDELDELVGDEGEPAARLLGALASQSPYLMAPLIREPRRLRALALDPYLGREKDAATMRAELAALLDGGRELAAGLREYRNGEYLRLGARELGWGAQEEVARELAHLADVTLDAALTHVRAELVARHGEPLTADGKPCRFVVFGMGKLGGEELNFSSDIDLLYLYETDQGAAGALSLHEFFARLCERLTRAIGDVTDDGYVFRVDLRLRPEGTRGPVCNSLGAAERYYESFGRPWERQAWVKARAVAGDRDLGDEALAMLAPFVWPRTAGGEIIRAVHELMARMRAERAPKSNGRDVKLDEGGIREVEFFTQALQLVHGGRDPSLRERGTLRALDRLRTAGIVSEREHRTLADAYVFLRRVEHRLQLAEGRQTHALPDDEALLARRLEFADRESFTQQLSLIRRHVSEIFATLGAPAATPPAVLALLDATATRAQLDAAVRSLGFRNPDAAADEIARFAPAAPAELAPVLLEEVAASPDPDMALRRLNDLVARRGAGASIWRLVAQHRPLARLLVTLFGSSEFLGKTLVAHPELVEQMLSAASSTRVRSRDEIDALVMHAQDGIDTGDPNNEEARLNALRKLRNEELLRVGLFDVGGELTPAEVSAQLTDLADAILEAALAIVAPPTFRKWGTPAASLAVLGLGKLGGRELTYASDLDVIFIYSDEGEAFEVMSRLAQRLVHALSSYLDEGRLYEIDTRLRPSGQKGTLVSSLAGFRSYHAKEAALWERQALIKARTVAGDRALGAQIEALAQQIVYGEAPVDAGEIGRIRARMEKEIAQETAHRFNIKTGRGGLVDVEFLVQYLQLAHGPRVPSLRERATADALAALEREHILPGADARVLAESYAFLRRLENRLRIVHDRAIQQISDRAGELDTLARRLGYHGDDAGARLLADYRAHTERIRARYARWLPAERPLQDS